MGPVEWRCPFGGVRLEAGGVWGGSRPGFDPVIPDPVMGYEWVHITSRYDWQSRPTCAVSGAFLQVLGDQADKGPPSPALPATARHKRPIYHPAPSGHFKHPYLAAPSQKPATRLLSGAFCRGVRSLSLTTALWCKSTPGHWQLDAHYVRSLGVMSPLLTHKLAHCLRWQLPRPNDLCIP